MSFDAYNESDGLVATVNGALKERGIIRNTLRLIKSNGIETTLFIAGDTYGLSLGRPKKMVEPIK